MTFDLTKGKLYEVSQYNHGHEYRWIYDEKTLRDKLGLKEDEDILTLSGEDIHFPIGGSNSSATWIKELISKEDVADTLLRDGDGPDLEDPELVDIAEYILTISTDLCSCTQAFIDSLGLTVEVLEKHDDRYKRREKAEGMIKGLRKAGYKDFDYSDPFYGKNRSMTFSELEELYEKVTGNQIEAKEIITW